MGFTCEDIKNFDNPYGELGNVDALALHLNEINKLTDAEKQNLATGMVLGCPKDQLGEFRHVIEVARQPQDDNDTFHSVLSGAYEVRTRINALMDPQNKTPHRLILGNELNNELFQKFQNLAQRVLQNNEVSIASRLALTTPAENRSQLNLNIQSLFPRSVLAQKIGAAFTLRRSIDTDLLGENPENFFSSRDFTPSLCHEFPNLISELLKGKEKEIGEKLAKVDNHTCSKIETKLEQMNPKATDPESPCRLIAAAMSAAKEQAANGKKETVNNRHSLFPAATSSQSTADVMRASEGNDFFEVDSDSEDDDINLDQKKSSFCGMFNC